MGARKNFTLSGFGILNIPVAIHKISKESKSSLREIHRTCGHKLGRKTWCNTCNVEVPPEDKWKGYDFTGKDEMPMMLTPEELDSVRPSDIPLATIEIMNVIDALDYRWFNGDHYIVRPKDKNPLFAAPFNLLLTGLERQNKVALVRWFDSRVVYNGTLDSNGIISAIFYGDEVDVDAHNTVGEVKVELVNMISELIKRTAKPFNPQTDVVNTYRELLDKLVAEKKEKGTFTAPEGKPEPKQDASQSLEALLAMALASAGGSVTPEPEVKATGTNDTVATAIPATTPPKVRRAKKA